MTEENERQDPAEANRLDVAVETEKQPVEPDAPESTTVQTTVTQTHDDN